MFHSPFVVVSIFSGLSSPADLRAFLSLQLKCAHLVPAKSPLLEEAIFNQNKAAVEKWRAACKA
jgi:hypothetical protein